MRYLFSYIKPKFDSLLFCSSACFRRIPAILLPPNAVGIYPKYGASRYSSFVHSTFHVNNHVVGLQEIFHRNSHVVGLQVVPESEKNGSYTNGVNSDFTSITNGDPVLEKKLKILFLETEVLRQNGGRVPLNIKLDQWKELLRTETRSRRRKYLAYLFGVEKKKENTKQKKEERKSKREATLKEPIESENGHLTYGLGQNTMFLRIYDNKITHFHNSKLIQAMQFGPKVVFDCSYDSHMTRHEAHNCAKQLMLAFSENRVVDNPFDLFFCNVNSESVSMKQLLKYIPTLYDSDFPLNLTDKNYLDIFPKENLVYLTPHCREELTEFDHDAVYVIGAMVDKANCEPLSLAKAKREGLKMAKFPLDKYLLWGSGGSKSLTLNQVVKILMEIQTTGDWNKALKHVPKRKVASDKPETDHYKNMFRTKERYRPS